MLTNKILPKIKSQRSTTFGGWIFFASFEEWRPLNLEQKEINTNVELHKSVKFLATLRNKPEKQMKGWSLNSEERGISFLNKPHFKANKRRTKKIIIITEEWMNVDSTFQIELIRIH